MHQITGMRDTHGGAAVSYIIHWYTEKDGLGAWTQGVDAG